MKINEKIKELRLNKGWTQSELGKKLNPPVSRQAVQQIESGKVVPNFERLEDIARAFSTVHIYFTECG